MAPRGPQRKAFGASPMEPRPVPGGREIVWACVIDLEMTRTSHEKYAVRPSGQRQRAVMPLVDNAGEVELT